MNYELYEVWAVNDAGHEELLETTASKKEAYEIAEANLGLGHYQTVVYREDENGELEEVERFEIG